VAEGAARVLVLSRTVMLSPSVTLTTLPVRESAEAAMDRNARRQRVMTRAVCSNDVSEVTELIYAVFFRNHASPIIRMKPW